MARTGWGASNWLRYGGAPLTGYPLTLACWVKPPTGVFTGAAHFLGLYNSGAADNRDQFSLRSRADDAALFVASDSVDSTTAATASTFAADTWGHICGVGVSATSRAVFLNGAGKVTSSTSRTPAGIDRTSIGRADNAGTANTPPSDTFIAEAAIWNIDLTDAEVAMLGAGRVSPLLVRPANLVAYWPLIGAYSPEIELKARQELAIQGSLSAAPHAPIIYPARRRLGKFTAPPPPPTGTVAQTLPKLAQSTAGSEKFTGTVAQALPALAQAATGTVIVQARPDHRRVIALVATPFDDSITASVQGPPWPFGALEAVFGGLEEFSIAGGETAVYASDIGYRSKRTDSPALTWFPPRLTVSLNYSVELFQGFEPDGEARVDDGGNIDLLDEKGDLDFWLDYAFDGRSLRLYRGEKSAAFSSFTRVFIGGADGLEATDRGKRIRLRDRRAATGRLLQTSLYGGSGGLEGDAGVANMPRPLGWGPVRNAPGRLLDSTNLVIQLHDGAIHAVIEVRDKGVALTPTADYPTLAALLGASLSGGQFATCLALGLIRLGGSATGSVTVDFEGGLAPDGSYPERSGAIMTLIATTRLGEDSFSAADLVGFTALDASQPAVVHYYCDRAGVTAGQALTEIAFGVGASVWATPDGMLNVKRLEAPAGPADHVIAKRNIGEAGIRRVVSVPTHRRRVGYDRMWTVQSPDQLHEELLDADRQLYGNEYRWATASNPSVPYRHRRASERDHRALFADEADAITEVARVQALHGVERRRLSVPVVGIDPFSIKAGQTVELQGYNRLGLDPAGSFWIVIGVTAVLSLTETRLALTLWG